MDKLLFELLLAVTTAAIPVLTAHIVKYISKAKEEAIANTDDTRSQGYIREIADAISAAVSATSQTYVDALKRSGTFTVEAQKEAARKALSACLAALSPAAKAFIDSMYGDINEYLTVKIEAEVRKQKNDTPAELAIAPLLESTDPTATAASAAAAAIAAIKQADMS